MNWSKRSAGNASGAPPPAGEPEDSEPGQHHGNGEDLPHRGAAGQKSEEGIRLPEKLAADARDAVAGYENSGQRARAAAERLRTRGEKQHDEEDDALETGLY